MKTLLSFLLSMLTFTALAQYKLSGTVIEKTNQPAAYATVALVQASDSSIVKGGLTDESGHFVVTNIAPGTYRARISSVGYSDFYSPAITIKNSPVTDLGTLTLESVARNLETVTVKAQASLVSQLADRIVMNVEGSVITRGNKVEDLLRYAPRVRYDNGNVSVGNKSNVLILVDGRQMGQASLSSFLQTFSAEDILRLEVITNPSARYDATVEAVINIVTKKSREQGINGRATATYSQGQYGRSSVSGSLTYRQGKWTVFGSLNAALPSTAYSTQLLNRSFPDAFQQNDISTRNTYQSAAVNLGIDYAFNSRHTLGLRLNGKLGQDAKDTRTITRSGASQRVDSTIRTLNDGHETAGSYDLNVNYKGLFGNATTPGGQKELTVFITESFVDKDATQLIQYQKDVTTDAAVGPAALLRILNPNKQRNVIGQIDFGTPLPGGKWRMDIGAKYVFIRNDNHLQQQNFISNQYITDPAFSNIGVYQENTYAAYTNFSRQFSKGWSIQAGLRAERTEQNLTQSALSRVYHGLFPSFGLNRTLPNGQSWGLTLSRKVNRPSLNSLVPYRHLIDPYTLIQGNPMIRPSFSHTLDAFYSAGNLTLFANYSYVRDQITTVLQANDQTLQYTQIDANLRSGNDIYLGATYVRNLTKWWQTNTTVMGMGNYTNSPINELSSYRSSGAWVNMNSTNMFTLPNDWKYEITLMYMSPARAGLFTQKGFGGVSMSVNKSLLARQANLRIDVSDVFRTMYSRLVSNYGLVDFTMKSVYDSQRVKVSFSYTFGKKTVKAARTTDLGNDDEKGRMNQ